MARLGDGFERQNARRPSVRHGRRGREGRSSVVRPPLPRLDNRLDRFDVAVTTTVDFLRSAWPELRDVTFTVSSMPTEPSDQGIRRYTIDTERSAITIHRLPIERLERVHVDDDLHRRMMIESIVLRAAADFLGRDPWDIGIDPID